MKKDKLLNWYVAQTKAGDEKKIKTKVEKLNLKGLKTFLPQRKLIIRKRGEFLYELKPLFPGYFFINIEMEPAVLNKLNEIRGLIKILGNEKRLPQQVNPEEMELIFSLIKEDNIIPPSKAFFVNDRIRIVAGPLAELEARILSVDKRKKRVKVKLPFFNTYKDVYLSFEIIEKA